MHAPKFYFFPLVIICKLVKSGCTFGETSASSISATYKCGNVSIYKLKLASNGCLTNRLKQKTKQKPNKQKLATTNQTLQNNQTIKYHLCVQYRYLLKIYFPPATVRIIPVFKTMKKGMNTTFIMTRIFLPPLRLSADFAIIKTVADA